MRPVNKKLSPKQYNHYKDARDDLADRIGWYCSYCEMPVKNLLAVEHIIPKNNGGSELEWHNFLLSCTYCNSVKGYKNHLRLGYYWADMDNTFSKFIYHPFFPILPHPSLNRREHILAENTIGLTGLNRHPGSIPPPTLRDTRWKSRREAWELAYNSMANWREAKSTALKIRDNTVNELIGLLLKQIVNSAVGTGHFSIWMTVFDTEKEIQIALVDAFVGTQKRYFNI